MYFIDIIKRKLSPMYEFNQKLSQ